MRGGVLLALGAVLALGISDQHAAPIDDPLRDALSGIDYVAGKNVFDNLLGTGADSDLVAIARDVDGDADPGLRIRAYRALSLYSTPLVETALTEAVNDHAAPSKTIGVEVVYAKAAMDSLAAVAGAGAVDTIAAVLDHPSRDLRVSAARALAKTAAPAAIAPLQSRLAIETDSLVSLALQRALSLLEES